MLFWTRTKNTVTMSFSYDKDKTTQNMASKYGGDLVLNLETPYLPGKVVSYLKNEAPIEDAQAVTGGPFKVMVLNRSGQWSLESAYETITEANSKAKEIIKFYSEVAVVKQ